VEKLTRQDAIKVIVLPAFAAAIGVTTTIADAKSSKASVKYQNKPKGTQKCSGCKFFIPGKTSKSMGTCQIVDGSISPNGWCAAYTKK
jgi:hypothetical protein